MIEQLNIETKTNNQGVSSAGKLSAGEFNKIPEKINEIIEVVNGTVYLSQLAFDALVANNELVEGVEYNVY